MRLHVRSILKQLNSSSVQSVCNDLVDIISGLDTGDGGQTVLSISHLIFEKAIDHTQQVELYARLCRYIINDINTKYPPHPTQMMNGCGDPICDNFMQQILRLCQEQFEQNFANVRPTWVDVSVRISALSDNLLSDEDLDHTIAIIRSKRQALGTMKFMAELYSHNLIPQSMLANNVEVLLDNLENDDNKYKIEGLRLLLSSLVAAEAPKTLVPELDRGHTVGEGPDEKGHLTVPMQKPEEKVDNSSYINYFTATSPVTNDKQRPGTHDLTGAKAIFVTTFSGMGNYGTNPSTSKLSSKNRFAASATRAVSDSGAPGMQHTTRPTAMTCTASQGGPGGALLREHTRSKRGEQRHENNKAPVASYQQQQQRMMSMEPVEPLQATANRRDCQAIVVNADSPETVDRKVRGLLNKLTMEKFDSISDQIIMWANKSEKEKDGRTLVQVIRLTYHSATDDAKYTEAYARLCRKMLEQISPKVQDDRIKNNEGKPVAGGQLFRKYMLNCCQEGFERGWVTKETTAASVAAKFDNIEAVKAANNTTKASGKEAIPWAEYCTAQKAKRQGLGLIKFIGELFKMQMLTERIMHECVKKLLVNVDNPEEEEIESLCTLLTTVGGILDTPKARAHLDLYISRMKELTKSPNVNSRMRYMLIDVIELRDRKWVADDCLNPRECNVATKEKAATEKEAYQRQMSMPRGGSRRGGDRNDYPQVGPDGWAVAGRSSDPQGWTPAELWQNQQEWEELRAEQCICRQEGRKPV